MKILFPNNIFTKLLYNNFPSDKKEDILFLPASIISSKIKEEENVVGLIPTVDILNYKDFFVSSKFGISFEGSLCNSYLYFNSGKRELNEIYLSGDVSSLEVIITKILMKEMYGYDIEIKILTDESKFPEVNLLLTGDNNFLSSKFDSAVSFSDEIIEVLSLPFVNFVIASNSEGSVNEFEKIARGISGQIYNSIETGNLPLNFSDDVIKYFQKNVSSIVYDFDPNDVDGIKQLLRLPYYHGLIENIVEAKFI